MASSHRGPCDCSRWAATSDQANTILQSAAAQQQHSQLPGACTCIAARHPGSLSTDPAQVHCGMGGQPIQTSQPTPTIANWCHEFRRCLWCLASPTPHSEGTSPGLQCCQKEDSRCYQPPGPCYRPRHPVSAPPVPAATVGHRKDCLPPAQLQADRIAVAHAAAG